MCTWTGAAPNIYRATEIVGAQIEGTQELLETSHSLTNVV